MTTIYPLSYAKSLISFDGGIQQIGASAAEFSFDNERPRHRVLVESFALADRLITNGEYLDFIRDGGYRRPELWLSDGWDHVQRLQWSRPLYWSESLDSEFTLHGLADLTWNAPVCHVSYNEADAFARWAGKRLPSEIEWETAAGAASVSGNLFGSELFHPLPANAQERFAVNQLFGDVWEWTASPYAPYPGFAPLRGALGEYNGKFMSNRMVLRGGSCATPDEHIRASYSNYFDPHTRWQFTGGCALPTNHARQLTGYGESTLDAFDNPRVRRELTEEVLAGLRKSPKEIASSWLYDEAGSVLFDMICELPEYYPMRTELSIMRDHSGDMARQLGEHVALIEFGSGTSLKTRLLLDRLDADVYVPIDIACIHLLDAASAIARDYPWLTVAPLCGDFTRRIALPARAAAAERRVIYFPGSTIGNFELAAARQLLGSIRELVGSEGAVLIGVDLKIDPSVLERAYNDREGVTARFNLNVLRHVNRVLGSDFRLDAFAHSAVWVEAHSRIEMRLVSQRAQRVRLGGQTIAIGQGEFIRTEYCHKYTLESFADLADSAGYDVRCVWCDPQRLFSVQLLEPRLLGAHTSVQ